MSTAADPEGTEFDDEFSDELKPGTTLLQGQYTIDSFLNSGGFGITYLARDSLDRKVVIKECFPSSFCRRSRAVIHVRSRAYQGEFKSVVKLFVQEARSLSKLSHPNIVGVHQVFEDNGTAYMALDLIEGRDLLDTLEDKKNKLTPAEIKDILKQLLNAVAYIHDENVLHRDISPDNILITPSKKPVLIDFGAAREQAAKTNRVLSALLVVKDGYSPQEFYIGGSQQNPSSDLYALGASFYHLIVGEIPPNSQVRLAAMAAQDPDPYKPLTGSVKGYDAAFLAALDKSLQVMPKDRLQTAQEWLEAIDSDKDAGGKAEKKAVVTPKRVVSKDVTRDVAKKDAEANAKIEATVVGLIEEQEKTEKQTKETTQKQAEKAEAEKLSKEKAEKQAKKVEALKKAVADQSTESLEDEQLEDEQEDAASDLSNMLGKAGASGSPSKSRSPKMVLSLAAAVVVAIGVAGMQTGMFFGNDAPEPSPNATPVTEPAAEVTTELSLPATTLPTDLGEPPVVQSGNGAEDTDVNTSLPTIVAVAAPNAVDPALQAVDTAPFPEPIKAVPDMKVLTSEWTVRLPFRASTRTPNEIGSVVRGAESWVLREQAIVSVNGISIDSISDIGSVLRDTMELGISTEIPVEFEVRDAETGDVAKHATILPVIQETNVMNGTRFHTAYVNGEWQTKVVANLDAASSDLEIGDILFADLITNKGFAERDAIAETLNSGVAEGREKFNFMVIRDGSNSFASLDLTGVGER